MKIAASDFDGTISFYEKGIPEENLNAIHEWQEAGHKFGLVTGRNLGLARHGLEGYDLNPDFFVCLNGAAAFDKDGQLLFAKLISSDILTRLLKHPAALESRRIGILQPVNSYGYIRRRSPEDKPLERLPIKSIEESDILNTKDVAQISLMSDTPESAASAAEAINCDFHMQLCASSNGKFIDVNAYGCDKGTGLDNLLKCTGWQAEDILTVGDNLNDIPMLRKFRGFTIENCINEVKAIAEKVYPSVAEMLRNHI